LQGRRRPVREENDGSKICCGEAAEGTLRPRADRYQQSAAPAGGARATSKGKVVVADCPGRPPRSSSGFGSFEIPSLSSAPVTRSR
jgi:hypothetical protein